MAGSAAAGSLPSCTESGTSGACRYGAPFYSKPQVDRVVKNSADHEDEAVTLCQDVWEKM